MLGRKVHNLNSHTHTTKSWPRRLILQQLLCLLHRDINNFPRHSDAPTPPPWNLTTAHPLFPFWFLYVLHPKSDSLRSLTDLVWIYYLSHFISDAVIPYWMSLNILFRPCYFWHYYSYRPSLNILFQPCYLWHSHLLLTQSEYMISAMLFLTLACPTDWV